MFHRSLALLLIVHLLACPLRCQSCEASATAGEASAPAATSCCPHTEDVPAPDSHDQCPDGQCSCENCICEGAVVEDDVDLPEATDVFVAWVHTLVLSTFPSSALDASFEGQSSGPPAAALSGRDVRIAHQSWLI